MIPVHAFLIAPSSFKENIHSGFSDIFVSDSTESYDVNCKMISDISKVVFEILEK